LHVGSTSQINFCLCRLLQKQIFLYVIFFRLLLTLFVLFLNKPFSPKEISSRVTHLPSTVIIYRYALLHKCEDCLFLFYLTTLSQLSTALTKMLLDFDVVALLLMVVVKMI
jgi:hypothetical protein